MRTTTQALRWLSAPVPWRGAWVLAVAAIVGGIPLAAFSYAAMTGQARDIPAFITALAIFFATVGGVIAGLGLFGHFTWRAERRRNEGMSS